jgi:hypothetical protein
LVTEKMPSHDLATYVIRWARFMDQFQNLSLWKIWPWR